MKRVFPYIITLFVGLGITVTVICGMKIWTASSNSVILQILSDAFFVSGAVIFGIGILVFCSNGGVFRMLSYAVIKIVDLFRRGAKGKYKDFYEYAESKKENKHSYGYMLIVGAAFIVVAVAFLIAYYKV